MCCQWNSQDSAIDDVLLNGGVAVDKVSMMKIMKSTYFAPKLIVSVPKFIWVAGEEWFKKEWNLSRYTKGRNR